MDAERLFAVRIDSIVRNTMKEQIEIIAQSLPNLYQEDWRH